jgi:hypothetical protein
MARPSAYRLSGVSVASEIPLPTAPLAGEASPDSVVFRIAPALSGVPEPGPAWEERNHGVAQSRAPGGFVIRFPGWAEFWIAADGGEVVGAPLDDSPPETLAQLFLDQILPLALHARGRFALHASAVALGGRDLVGFLGHAGAGKSTLAGSLARGAEDLLLADDCLALDPRSDEILAHPSYASARLWAESAGALFPDRASLPLASPRTTKLRASLPGAAEPMPLRRLYLIVPAEGPPAITPLPRRRALMELASHLYRLDPRDRERLAGELDLLERLVSTVPVAELAYRRAYEDLPAVREAILADLAR